MILRDDLPPEIVNINTRLEKFLFQRKDTDSGLPEVADTRERVAGLKELS